MPLGINIFASLAFLTTLIGGSMIFEGGFEVRPNEVTLDCTGMISLRIRRVYNFIWTIS
jgi:hypothetical protein